MNSSRNADWKRRPLRYGRKILRRWCRCADLASRSKVICATRYARLTKVNAAASFCWACLLPIGNHSPMTDESVGKVIAMINRALETPVDHLSANSRVLEIAGFDS